MRLVVDLNRCQGYAQCVFLAPDVFSLKGEEALRYTPYVDDARREQVAAAVAACPVQAILTDDVIDDAMDDVGDVDDVGDDMTGDPLPAAFDVHH
ncbi:ferredoxin [Streptomyces sp. NBS 14/10]|uniref:ferredoxin n=1 Tax=Streptomyces sp. NBS 14/10 TaxID=1945643 RepID=UPI000B9C7C19|nr:ferredoxin [Streptomyces sp. NBS 14/10]KAK1180955.1 ferredoxin [Streptomyces sp. NBS 14/10]